MPPPNPPVPPDAGRADAPRLLDPSTWDGFDAPRITFRLSLVATLTAASFELVLLAVGGMALVDHLIVAGLIAGSAASAWLATRGRARLAAALVIGTLWGIAVLSIVIHGVRATALPTLTVSTILAALWAGPRAAIGLLGASAVVLLGGVGVFGDLYPPPLPVEPLVDTILIIGQFVFIGALVGFTSRAIGDVRRGARAKDEMLARATEELEASRTAQEVTESRYAELVQALPDVVFVFAADGTIAEVNATVTQLLGVDPTVIVGTRLGEYGLLEPDEAKGIYAALARVLQGERLPPITLRLRHQSGTYRWAEATTRLVVTPDGQRRVLAIVRDITDRREAEHSRRVLAQAVEWAQGAMSMTDTAGVLTYVNDAFVKMWGYADASQCVGRPALEFWKDPDAAIAVISAVREDHHFVRGTLTGLKADGSTFVADLAANVVYDEGGRMIGMMGSFADVTAKVAAEQALRDREAKLVRAGRIARLGGWEVDLERGALLWDEQVRRIHEVPADFEPTVEQALAFYAPESKPIITAAFERLIASGEGFNLELDIVTAAGRRVHVRSQGEVERRDGRIVKAVGIFQDITELHEASEQLRLAEERLRETQKLESLGRLAGGVAHDFNNLLTAILGYAAEIQETNPADSPVAQDAAEIVRAAGRARDLTKQLLAFGRRQMSMPKVLDVAEQLESLTRFLGRLIGEDVRLVIDVGADVGAVRVDPSQFEQIFMNLAANARDAMPNGGTLTIAARRVSLDEAGAERRGLAPGAYVQFTVRDTGEGMAPDVAARVFEPFFTTKELGKGTGLGLATVYGILQQAGGQVEVASAPGQGTTFVLYLPHVLAAPAETGVAPQERAPQGGHERLLLVEDDAGVRRFAERVLQHAGYDLVIADSVTAAEREAAAAAHPFDLVITDVVMPDGSGPELVERLSDGHAEVPVLFVSGYAEDRLADVTFGPTRAFLQKPYRRHELLEQVRRLLDER